MPLTASWISKRPDRCGADACVPDTRITVWGLIAYQRLGMSDSDIRRAVAGLTQADLDAACEYAAAVPKSISKSGRMRRAKQALWSK